jgi:ketosteroid isomerase-like protein
MSRENVEVVTAMLADFNAFSRCLTLVSPDFVWDLSTFEGWPDKAEFRGVPAFIEFLRTWLEPYDEWELESEDTVEAAGGKVVAILRQRGRPRDSDSQVELRYGIVYTVERGVVQRAQVYATREEALEAAGLRE